MTSANVYYLRFQDIRTNKVLHEQRMHALCKERYDWDIILSLPLNSTEILTWGYDEEEEYWDSINGYEDQYDGPDETMVLLEEDNESRLPTLRKWLSEMKPTNKELREKLLEKNINV